MNSSGKPGRVERPSTLSALVFALLVALCPAVPAQSDNAIKPNIIVIFADDMGYGDVGVYGATDIQTPNIDRLANEGVMLRSFYTATVCTLSRAMLLTGSYQPRVSVTRNFVPNSTTGIHQDEILLPELLKGAGYATGMFGKWHLGDHYQFLPMRHGFDEYYGIPYSNDMWPFHPRNTPQPDEDPRLIEARERAALTGYQSSETYFPLGEELPNLPLYDNDVIVEFNTDQREFGGGFVDRALDFIERNRDGPFFVYLPLTAPHVPLHPSDEFLGSSSRDLYGDTVQEIDHGVGRLLARLVELGIDNDTVVVFMSDNGPWAEYGIDGGSAGPLAGDKGTQYEGGVRVPALVRWPGGLAPQPPLETPVSLTDIYPTLAGLAGVELPAGRRIDGADAWPVISGQVAGPVQEAVFGFRERTWGVVELGFVRKGPWKLHARSTGRTVEPLLLFNLDADIDESNNRLGAEPAVVASLVDLGERLLADIIDNQRPLGRVELSGEPFAQKPGFGRFISIEAEHFHSQDVAGAHRWEVVTPRGSSAEQALQALPDNGTWIPEDYAGSSPHLRYRVVIEEPGRYYVWARGRAANTQSDSLHVGLNGEAVDSGKWLQQIEDYWSWTSTRDGGQRAWLDVSEAGEHVIDVWMREDGIVLDKLILTTEAGFTPVGGGVVESRQSYDGLAVPPSAVDDGPYVVSEGSRFLGPANLLDNDEPDPRNDPMFAALVSPPQHAAEFELRPDGSFTYVHDGSETTSDSFTYTANDIDGASRPAVVRLSVSPVNDPPVIELVGAAELLLEVGAIYTDPGATASDPEDGDLTDVIVVGGDVVDTAAIGEYVVTYDVTDAEGQSASTAVRTVRVVDGNPPVITLIGPASLEVLEGRPYVEPGISAIDPEEGDISARVLVGGDTVDTSTVGTYVVTYNVSDSFGNAAPEVSRTVVVVEDEPPTISLNGSAAVSVVRGGSFSDPGATASDKEDGDLTSDIVVGGAVDTSAVGTYVLTYNVTDSGGNAAAEVRRTVTVTAPPEQRSSGGGGGGGRLGLLTLLALGAIALLRRRTPSG